MSDATADAHILEATSDFPTAVGPAMTITNGLYCCLFSALAAADAVLDIIAGLIDDESGLSRFLEFIPIDVVDEKKADDEDLADNK